MKYFSMFTGIGGFEYGTRSISELGFAGELDKRATKTLPTISTKPIGRGECVIIEAKGKRRWLTMIECERLQGFPDDFTKIPYRGKPVENCPDGPRYKAMGNSMAVPVMRWIGERIEMVAGEADAT